MVLYRIEYIPDSAEIGEDIWTETYKLTLLKLNVVRETPCGYWVNPYNNHWCKEKWVPKHAKKRYAYDTIQGARTNFIKRNQKRLRLLKYQIEAVEKSLKLVENFYKPKQKREVNER